MANLIGLNYESFIADLRKQRNALMQAVHQIDQAISSLEAIPGLVGSAAEMEKSDTSAVITKPSGMTAKPEHAGNPLTVAVAEESLAVIKKITGDITQPLILQTLLEQFPGSEQTAKDKQWSARIAGVLRRLVEKGDLIKIKESHSNNPSIYRKTVEMTDAEKVLANIDTSK